MLPFDTPTGLHNMSPADSYDRRLAICDAISEVLAGAEGDEDHFTPFASGLLPELYPEDHLIDDAEEASPVLLETRIKSVPHFLGALVERGVISADDCAQTLSRIGALGYEE